MRRLVRRYNYRGVHLTRNEGGWTPPRARISIKMKEFGGIGDFEGQRMSKTSPIGSGRTSIFGTHYRKSTDSFTGLPVQD